MRTFREEANAVLRRARRLQVAGLAMMLGVFFFLPFYPWLMPVAVGGVVLQMAGHWKLRKLKCPGCGKDLRFLVYDPSYSGQFPGGVVAPKAFAPKVSRCGYCGRSFDVGCGKDAQDGEDAKDETGGMGAARQNGDGGRMGRGVALVAGVVLALACGAAEGAFMEFGGDPVDYVKIRLWKEDGELKSEFRGVETEFGEIAAVFGRIAGRGHADWPVHWLVGREVTVGELSAKVGALAALGFTNQFFLAVGETAAQHLEFDLANFAVWDGEELEDGEEKGLVEGAEESFSGDGPVELTIAEDVSSWTIAEDVSSCTWTVKDFEEQERRQEEEAVRWNADVKVEGDEVRLTLSRDGDRGGKTE